MNYWKLAIFKVCLYSVVVGASDFLTDTETWSQETWNATGWFELCRIWVSNWVAMAGVVLAFLDTSMGQLREQSNKHKLQEVNTGP